MYINCCFVLLQVSDLCIGEYPSISNVELFIDDSVVGNVKNVTLPLDTDNNLMTVNTTLTVLEDQRYNAKVTFSNLAGDFEILTSETNFSKLTGKIIFTTIIKL